MWYDLIILALLVICTVRGATKGFAWQVAAIGSLLLCFFFAQTASVAIAPLIHLDPPLNRWVAMFVLYMVASFVSFGAARAVRRTLESWQFVEYDRHLGAVFGLLKGVGFALVITFFAVTLSDKARATVLTSYSGHAAGNILAALHPVMPDELHGVIDPYLEKLGRTVVHDHDLGPGGDPASDFGTLPYGGEVPNPASPNGGPWPGADEFGPPPTVVMPSPRSWPAAPNAARNPAPTTYAGHARGGDEAERLVDALSGLDPDLKSLAVKALRNTPPEDRVELTNALQTAIPGLIRAVATEWQDGKRDTAARPSARDRTLREIAGIYTQNLEAQASIIREAESRLRGVPDEVALVVVQDWYADLLNLTPDPDPTTNLATPLDARLARQLRSFRTPPDRLGADARARLQQPPR